MFAYEIDESIIKFLKKNAEAGYPIPPVEIVEGGEITLISHGLAPNKNCTFAASIDSEEKSFYPIVVDGTKEDFIDPNYLNGIVEDRAYQAQVSFHDGEEGAYGFSDREVNPVEPASFITKSKERN